MVLASNSTCLSCLGNWLAIQSLYRCAILPSNFVNTVDPRKKELNNFPKFLVKLMDKFSSRVNRIKKLSNSNDPRKNRLLVATTRYIILNLHMASEKQQTKCWKLSMCYTSWQVSQCHDFFILYLTVTSCCLFLQTNRSNLRKG